MSPSAAKTVHYEHQLYEALLKGAWADASPGRAYNGAALGWSELHRKFRKHVPNHPDLANVASQTQALALLVVPLGDSTVSVDSISPEALDGDVSDPAMPLRVGSECVLPKERREEALGCLNALGSANEISASKTSIQLARAHYAYALGNPSECLSIISQVDFNALPSLLPSSLSTPQDSVGRSTQRTSTTSTTPTSITNLTIESVLSRSASVSESSGSASMTIRKVEYESGLDVVWHATELLRGRCEEGMSHELLKDFVSASLAYDAGLVILDRLTSTKSFGKSERVKVETFRSHREMWRWAELLIRRRSILAAKFQPLSDTFIHFRAYQLYSSNWPLSFRPRGFGAIYSLYIRALCLSSPLSLTPNQLNGASLRHSSSLLSVSKFSHQTTTKRAVPSLKFPTSVMNWYVETKRAAEEYQRVLGSVTRFPKAEETNSAINSFVDLCVAVWERGGCSETETGWVIEILWWATRLTFHSQRIMRHLTRLLLASGNFTEAKRTFKLYVQLVTKSRQTSQGEVSLLLKRRPTNLPAEHPDTIAREEEEDGAAANGKKFKANEDLPDKSSGDLDDNETYLDALIYGIRMLCRYGDRDDVAEARRISDLVDVVIAERRKWPSLTLANVNIVRGILLWCEANLDHNPRARPTLLKQAKAALQNATTFKACPASAHFQLAIVQAAQRSIDNAILSARQALELAPKERRAWHLLALLLTAKEEWSNAKQLIDICLLETAEEDRDPASPPIIVNQDGLGAQENASLGLEGDGDPGALISEPMRTLIEPRSDQIPYPYTLLAGMSIAPPTSRHERFEASISLLLTQIAIIEKLEGADNANERLQELFTYFSSHSPSGTVPSSRRESLDASQFGGYAQSPITTGSVPRIEVNEPETPIAEYSGPRSTVSDSHSHRYSRLLRPRRKSDSGEWVDVERALEMHASVPDPPSQPEKPTKSILGSLTPSGMRSHSPGPSLRGYESVPHDLQRSLTPSPVLMPTPVQRTARENRLLSEVWLTSAAVFRRMRSYDQAKDAIGEAEMLDESNPGVWTQLGLYYMAVGDRTSSLESFSKALMLDSSNISATIHLARVYLDPLVPPAVAPSPSFPSTIRSPTEDGTDISAGRQPGTQKRDTSDIDMAAGLLENVTRRTIGFDVPEAWYFLSRAVGLQGRKEKQRECLIEALQLEEGRTVRGVKNALPVCL